MFPRTMASHIKIDLALGASRWGVPSASELGQQMVFVCRCIGVFKLNLPHKYMQQASFTSVHEVCSSATKKTKTKNRQASEITIMN